MKYRDIPESERKILTAEVSSTWGMRLLFFVCLFGSLQLSHPIRDYLIAHGVLPFGQFVSGLIVSLAVAFTALSIVYLPTIRWNVVRRKKA